MHSSDPKLPEVRCRSWRAETLQDQFGGQIQPAQAPVGPETRVFASHAPTVTQDRKLRLEHPNRHSLPLKPRLGGLRSAAGLVSRR